MSRTKPQLIDLFLEAYQLAGALLLAPDHYTQESAGLLAVLLLDVLAEPEKWTADRVHAEWKRRAEMAEVAA